MLPRRLLSFATVTGLVASEAPFYERAGTRHYTVPLRPPQYLEFLTIEDCEVAATTATGRRTLACEAAGFGLLGWSVLVDDLEACSKRLGIEVFDYTLPHGDGTLRGWRAVSGPPHLPSLIDYPNNGDRRGRLQAMYERVDHTSMPTVFSSLTIGGSEGEMREWLGPHDLPLRFVDGDEGIRDARIFTKDGEVVIT